jgi:hypothetical protein
VILLTGFYLDPDPARCRELLECLSRNAMNEVIEEVHVLLEEMVDPSNLLASLSPAVRSKLRVVPQRGRPTFQSLFGYANTQPTASRVIIANADIYFDASLRRLQNFDLLGRLLCLSRWDVLADGSTRFFEHPASQDAWIFENPIRAFRCDFPLGVPACDNRLAWEADRAGLVVSNPSRSVHANHLHLSGIRRYVERERLSGPTKAVPAELLGTPWLWFVLAAVGRAADFSETVSSLAKQPCSNCIIAGDLAAYGLSTWVSASHGSVSVVAPAAESSVSVGQAWNRGAAGVEDDGITCFVEGGTVAEPGFSEHVLSRIAHDRFLMPDDADPKQATALVCGKAIFSSVAGFDETIVDPSRACADLRAALLLANVKPHSYCGGLLSHAARSEPSAPDPQPNELVGREPLAVVAFGETMGYTVARLTLGASSHNNDPRPFDAVPDILLGRVFTQVVSSRVSPVTIHFVQSGRLYVLVGTDWYGYHPATAWLSDKGRKETLPPVTTKRGTGFEIWSLLGSAGERFVIPTQVVLVADRLVRA